MRTRLPAPPSQISRDEHGRGRALFITLGRVHKVLVPVDVDQMQEVLFGRNNFSRGDLSGAQAPSFNFRVVRSSIDTDASSRLPWSRRSPSGRVVAR